MTPAARLAAAIAVLDEVLAGKPAEQALTNWARRSRFAGSKDRAAVRDHVFDAVRSRRSLAALGGAETGRGLILGLCRRCGPDPAEVFTGAAHAPEPLSETECGSGRDPQGDAERLDMPDWLWPRLLASLGEAAEPVAAALQQRAPVHLRVNLRRSDRAGAMASLLGEGIECVFHPAAETALEVTAGQRRIRRSDAYLSGLVELQDAASQAVVAGLPLRDGMRVLDYCAGGGGKALAMGARARIALHVHDAAPERMRDLPERAARAGVPVVALDGEALAAEAPFDLVLCDVPCSGSGAWRRAPDGKWRLTPARLDELARIQADILDRAAALVAPGGTLAYVTCSLLHEENGGRIAAFLERAAGWVCTSQRSWTPLDGADGFFAALLTRECVTI
ncbi:MAG: RsmB/NOP family class I SAM-dependent RNA methyltransferase [Jhaorihella sp.]